MRIYGAPVPALTRSPPFASKICGFNIICSDSPRAEHDEQPDQERGARIDAHTATRTDCFPGLPASESDDPLHRGQSAYHIDILLSSNSDEGGAEGADRDDWTPSAHGALEQLDALSGPTRARFEQLVDRT